MRATAQMRAAWASIKHHLTDYPGAEWALETFEDEIDFREPEQIEAEALVDYFMDPTNFLRP